jgi:hypothetical protein
LHATRKVLPLVAIITVAAATTATAGPPTYTVQTFQYPGDTFTQLLGINNSDVIGGFHGAVTPQGFTFTLPATFTSQNFPGSSTSMVTGINGNGDTSGIYVDAMATSHGYTDVGGVFQTVDEPGTVFNQALGINNGLETVGYSSATDLTGATGEVAYSQFGGVFKNLTLPSNVNSQAVGINNAGDIVGFYTPTSTTSLGFLDVGDVITKLDPFGSSSAQALGISNTGEIVGLYVDGGGATDGFVDIGGTFTSFTVPGSVGQTVVNGVNDKGQLVGFYADANGNTDGFVATPVPEPAAWALMTIGLGVIGGSLRRRRPSAIS